MADVTPGYVRGFLVPFQGQSRANLWTEESTLTEGTGRSGVPVSSGTDLIVTTTGEQTETINIKTIRGGHLSQKPGFAWKKSTDTDFHGFDQPNILTDLNVFIDNAGSSSIDYLITDAVRLPNGSIMIAYEEASTTNNKIYIATKSYITKSILPVLVATTTTTALSNEQQFPCLCVLPDDSVICAYWVNDNVDETAQIHINRSTDNGATWNLISSRALENSIDTGGTFGAGASGRQLDRLSMAANSHSVLLFAGTIAHNTSLSNASLVTQYASTSEGIFFNKIAESTTSTKYADPQVVSFNEAFIISWIDSPDTIAFTRLPNAFEDVFTRLVSTPLDTKSTYNTLDCARLDGNKWADYNRSMWIDTDGRMYTAHVLDANTGAPYEPQYIEIWYSDLKGLTFDQYGKDWLEYGVEALTTQGFQALYSSSNNGFGKIVGASGVGVQELFLKWGTATSNNYKGSIFRLSMGGWSNINYPALVKYPEDSNTSYNIEDWIPIDLPSVGGAWTATTAGPGAMTETLDTKLTLHGTGGKSKYYEKAITDKTGGIIMRAKLRTLNVGTADKGNGLRLQIQEQSTTDTLNVRVRLTHDAIYLGDMHNLGAGVSDTTNIASNSEYDIILWVDNKLNKAYLYYSRSPGDFGRPRTYLKLELSLVTDSASSQYMRFGILSNTGEIKGEWFYVSYSLGDATGRGISGIYPKQYPPQGYSVGVNGTFAISTKAGPARENDTYDVSPRFDTPIDRVLYNNSPSREVKWMSEQVANPDTTNVSNQKIAWLFDTTLKGTQDTKPLNDSIGIHLANINFREFQIEKYSGGSWSTIATFDNHWRGVKQTIVGSTFNFNFTRKGNAIICSDSSGPFTHFNECESWEIFLDNGSGTTVQRKILHNSEGALATHAGSKNSVLRLKDVKSTDPTSGTAYLIPNNCTVILNNIGDLAALRINITSQKTSSGRFEIGNMIMGPLIIPAHQYSRGRTISFEADIGETLIDNGTLYSKKLGSGGRVVRIAWTEGVDTSLLNKQRIISQLDYYKLASSGEAVATVGSAPTTALGLINYLNGSTEAITYLPTIITDYDNLLINTYNEQIMCTMGNDVQIENVVGDEILESGGEVFRVSTIVLRETR